MPLNLNVRLLSKPPMFSALKPIIYIQISPERLTLKNIKTGESFSEVPEMAISVPPKQRILAIGEHAKSAAAAQAGIVVNPFAHPRSLVSDFTAAEQLLKNQLRKALGRSVLSFAPYIVIHPLGFPAGGFTQVERRAFREMAIGAGAGEAHVWTGRPLTNEEVSSKQAPSGNGEWE